MKEEKKKSTSHGTYSELAFLDNIGTYSSVVEETKKHLLEKYYQAMSLRKNWGDINPKAVKAYIENELGLTKPQGSA